LREECAGEEDGGEDTEEEDGSVCSGFETRLFEGGLSVLGCRGEEERLTRRANVIPASNAPKNTQNPTKNTVQYLRDFLCA
jgi:hypothetical protein